LRFDVASLGDWLPASGGEAHGNVHISGQWPRLDIDGDASGRELTWSGVRVDSMELVAKVKNTEKPAGAVTLKAENVTRGDIRFASLVIEGDGNGVASTEARCRGHAGQRFRFAERRQRAPLAGSAEDTRLTRAVATFRISMRSAHGPGRPLRSRRVARRHAADPHTIRRIRRKYP
jgi:autotransporter translocation and assembly factor TamB